jgi:hypothetical protein
MFPSDSSLPLPDPSLPAGAGDPPVARLSVGAHEWVLEAGRSVSFGRGTPCDIRIAHDPVDEHVSRLAGVVEHVGERLVVRNVSTKRHLIVRTARGTERVLRPGEVLACGDREFLVALDGRDGRHHVIQVSSGPRSRGAGAS